MSTPAVERAAPGRRSIPKIGSLSLPRRRPPRRAPAHSATAGPTDPGELSATRLRGRLLAFAAGADVFLAFRPLLRALAGDLLPWRGKILLAITAATPGRTCGARARGVFRFRAEVGPSQLDGLPALVLTYDAPAHENPWPIRAVRDELRTVTVGSPGIAIGPVFVTLGGANTPRSSGWGSRAEPLPRG